MKTASIGKDARPDGDHANRASENSRPVRLIASTRLGQPRLSHAGAGHPPAIAPITSNGSTPEETSSGSSASGGSYERSCPQANNRTNGRRLRVTSSRIVPRSLGYPWGRRGPTPVLRRPPRVVDANSGRPQSRIQAGVGGCNIGPVEFLRCNPGKPDHLPGGRASIRALSAIPLTFGERWHRTRPGY